MSLDVLEEVFGEHAGYLVLFHHVPPDGIIVNLLVENVHGPVVFLGAGVPIILIGVTRRGGGGENRGVTVFRVWGKHIYKDYTPRGGVMRSYWNLRLFQGKQSVPFFFNKF